MSFSVLISVYQGDDPNLFDLSLRSIWYEQVIKPDEIVLVADGPLPSNIDEVIVHWKSVLGSRLNLVRFPVNKGLGAALRKGLTVAKNEIVARMDADDIALPDRFQHQLKEMEHNVDVDILGSFVEEIAWNGDKIGVRKMPIDHETIVSSLWASPLIHPTIMMRRSKILLAGNYDASYRRRQDYELWFRCAENGLRFHNLPVPLLLYRFGLHTHKKQSPRLALEQALIGYRGAGRLRMPWYQRAACFVPFIRSLLPGSIQHMAYRVLKRFDPRQKVQ